ncbi:MAG: hypothetical protein KatS3mg087_1197 [Patescibacteria group bacterium]|nr:MAG: hypothetical protein KatS3mg087_1197 [Patescibacteria group bacterium]
MKFKLLRGIHVQTENGKQVIYEASDPKRNVVESDRDLERLFGSEKFQRIIEDNATTSLVSNELEDKLKALQDENRRLKERLKKVV